MYWIFTVAAILMVAVLWLSRFPVVEHTDEERPGTLSMYRNLARQKVVWVYFIGIFAYTGCEQGTSDWISRFLSQYHGFDPHTSGAVAVSWFWGLLTGGCFIGMVLLKLFDSRRVLIAASAGALICLSLALFGTARVCLVTLPLIGLFASVMWPIVNSLALNSVKEFHGSFAGILNSGIIGGAVVPVVIGRLGDAFGLRRGMMFLYITFGIIAFIGFWATPLVTNATLGNSAKSNDEPAIV
jgi:fucose permease